MEETALSHKGRWRDPRRKQFCPLRAIGGTLEEEVLSQKGPLRDPRGKQFFIHHIRYILPSQGETPDGGPTRSVTGQAQRVSLYPN